MPAEVTRFPPPWIVDEGDAELDRRCFIVRDANGDALAYVYFEGEAGRQAVKAHVTASAFPPLSRHH